MVSYIYILLFLLNNYKTDSKLLISILKFLVYALYFCVESAMVVLGNISCWVSTSNLHRIERRFDIMNKRIFVIKILRYITIILLLLTNLVIVIKKWHLSQWLKCPSNLNWVDIQHNETECSLFSICKFSCYIHSIIKLIFLQGLNSLKINDLNYYDTI